jgi:hypothetical protein
MTDRFFEDELGRVGDSYLRLVKDRPAFAAAMAHRWQSIAEIESRIAAGRQSASHMPHAARRAGASYQPDPIEPEPEA